MLPDNLGLLWKCSGICTQKCTLRLNLAPLFQIAKNGFPVEIASHSLPFFDVRHTTLCKMAETEILTTFMTLCLMACVAIATQEETNMALLQTLALLQMINAKGKVRRRNYQVYRNSIAPYSLSHWQHMYLHGDDVSFYTTTGLDRKTFNFLLQQISPVLVKDNKVGRRRALPLHGELSLALHYLGGCPDKYLCVIFGVTLSTVNRTIHRVLNCLEHILPNLQEARIRWPTEVSAFYVYFHIEMNSSVITSPTNIANT